MKTYESMKSSNVLWLGDIPKHWECLKIGSLFSQRKVKVSDKDYAPLSVTKNGILPQLENAAKSDDSDNRKLVCAGDFVINSRSDRKGSCGVSEFNGSVSLINLVLILRNEWNNHYVHYLMRSQPFSEEYYRYGRGIVADLWTTRFSEMKNILLPVPPRDEQDRIVRFLDWKVSEINRLINVQKKFISIVAEQKEKIICDALLHGINNDVSYKNTGISWLSSIPSHWKVIKIKWLFDEADERNTDKNAELLTFSKKKGLIPFSEASDKLPSANDLSNYKIIHKGQLLENRMQAWHGMFICADKEGCVSPDYSVFSASKERELNVKFYEYVFRCHIWVEQFANASRGVGSGFNRLYTPQFGAIYTIYPEVSEQNQIVAYLDEQMQKIEAAIANKQKQIDTLQELKTRLISDVVTGKIDVRGVEIPDYEYVEEESDMENSDVEDEASDEVSGQY